MVKLKHPFPDSFFEEEDHLGFHIDRTRKEIWAVELDMLYELDRVCKKLNVQYFLDGGTLLGAVRDGHFIPWDDDIDVCMLREDYDRFIRLAPKEFEAPLFLQTAYTDPGYFREHAQLRNSETTGILPNELGLVTFNQGIFLDIFVLDELFPEKVDAQYAARKALLEEHRIRSVSPRGRSLRRLAQQLRYWQYRKKYGRPEQLYAKVEEIFRAKEKSPYVDYLMLNKNAGQMHRLRREWYEKAVLLPFEGELFPVPAGYEEYLSYYYGADWKTPKNVSSLHSQNGSLYLDVDRPYREFLTASGFDLPR